MLTLVLLINQVLVSSPLSLLDGMLKMDFILALTDDAFLLPIFLKRLLILLC